MSAKIILVFAFGFYQMYGSDCSNKELSRKTYEVIGKNKRTKIFVHWLVAREMRNLDMIKFRELEDSVHIYGKKKEHIRSLRMIKDFKEWQRNNNPEMSEIILVAAPPLWGRCLNELKKFFPNVKISVETFKKTIEKNFWFMDRSEVWWTRSERKWKLREKIISLLPWKVYEFLFS